MPRRQESQTLLLLEYNSLSGANGNRSWCRLKGGKGRDPTQSYDKSPKPSENESQDTTQIRNQNLDYTTIAD